jgi:pimeloyl-ACP methyl ester carboxylesterase
MKPFRSHRVMLRGFGHHVLTWGNPAAPKLFLLHGWMDVGASFQFLVDALAHDWYVIAPDLRGYGGSDWQAQGYWYPDYIADLEALLAVFAPGEATSLVGHSLGGNVVMHYAGIRPERVRAVVSLEGFGLVAENPENAPGKYRRWLDALAAPIEFKPYANLDAVADRLQKTNSRLARDRAMFLAAHWAQALPDGRARLASDPRHKLPFPTIYRMEEVYAIWREITAPTMWVAALDSEILRHLKMAAADESETDLVGKIRGRLAHVPHGQLATIADAGHMLHHDQPAAVAAAIEPFLEAAGARG